MIHSSGVIPGSVWERALQRAERKEGMTDGRPPHSAATGLHLSGYCPVPSSQAGCCQARDGGSENGWAGTVGEVGGDVQLRPRLQKHTNKRMWAAAAAWQFK